MNSESKHLVLLRHAQAEHGALRDVDRTLTIDGRHHAHIAGERLVAAMGVPDLVLCSTAVRTRQTWQLAAAGMGEISEPEVRYLEELYGADVTELLDVLRAVPESVTHLLVVGHEPVTSAVAHLLAGPGSEDAALHRVRTGISTAMAAVLAHEGPWSDLGPRSSVLTHLVSGREGG
ncbi:SixA phosphatase family protein [Ruania halotolerans]|uniref:SixA phosphatase family protein n=1 Tax=Ruania halotolerans TaxID=2897773 RepID=UPI001E63E774|nr:histidine phosphatase family protein [Ruania halotolerans]UFU05030.1 histidine phosphatase family protein [Ruania halotolerans]